MKDELNKPKAVTSVPVEPQNLAIFNMFFTMVAITKSLSAANSEMVKKWSADFSLTIDETSAFKMLLVKTYSRQSILMDYGNSAIYAIVLEGYKYRCAEKYDLVQ